MSWQRPAITIGIAALVVSPLFRERGWDDFPISSYPMFSRDIGRVAKLAHAVVVRADGTRRPAPPALVGTPEPMVASNILLRAIQSGTAPDLCRAIASRSKEGVAVEIVMSEFDTRQYFSDPERKPISRVVHARCDVRSTP